jgi:amino acid transporter/nucleotide-binding universal stress UspA family protein
MIATGTKRPRNLDTGRAAAILYGDWGTSKAYVVGLAFAVAGYSSFPLIAAMCLLTALVGVNYMAICKHYPDGGGVYASVRHRSKIISIVGAFLLIADYIVTAAISSLSAFQYLGWTHPELFAAVAIVLIGALNFFGPKHSAGLAFLVSVPTAIVVVILGAFCVPHIHDAIHSMRPLQGTFGHNWTGFVSIVLALSGVEAIANATGLMKLNPGSDEAHPCVTKTSTPAIIWVMVEVCFFTAFLGLAMLALKGLQIVPSPAGDDVNAPGSDGVRDYMLRYMAQIFVGGSMGSTAGHIAALAVSIVFGALLLSAVNTALMDIISVTFLMSRDTELPPLFSKLNKFGVPTAGIVFAAVIPTALVLMVGDMSGLADLYAVGVVGAIATNLGASSTDKKLPLLKWERALMFFTFLVMLSIEITLFATKPSARAFAVTLLTVGLILRGLAAERAERKKEQEAAAPAAAGHTATAITAKLLGINTGAASGEPMLCSVRGVGPTLDFAIDDAKKTDSPLYLLFIREQPAITPEDRKRKWMEDPEAAEIFAYAADRADGHTILPCYVVSDSVPDTIVEVAATVGTSRVILGAPRRNSLVNFLRGNLIRQVANLLPDEIHLLVYA